MSSTLPDHRSLAALMDEFLLDHITEHLPPPEIPLLTSNEEEALDRLRLEIDTRRDANVHKSHALKSRITTEQARLKELEKDFDPKAGTSSALFKHVKKQSALLQSVINNFNIATDEHNAGKYLTDIPMARSNVAVIESRLRAVEVALQGSIEHEVVESEMEGKGVEMETRGTEYSGDGVYTILTPFESVGSTEFDPDPRFAGLEGVEDRGGSLPPIGYFSV